MTNATDPSERTPDGAKRPLASPKGSLELENILETYRNADFSPKPFEPDLDEWTVKLEINHQTELAEALQAITALHDADIEYVSGEDEPEGFDGKDPSKFPNGRNYQATENNELRAVQRKRWEERHG